MTSREIIARPRTWLPSQLDPIGRQGCAMAGKARLSRRSQAQGLHLLDSGDHRKVLAFRPRMGSLFCGGEPMPTKSKATSNRQRCSRCKRSLALDKFSPYSRGKSGRWCRACKKAHRQSKQSTEKVKEA